MKEIFYDFRFALIALLAFVALACHSPASHAVSGCGYSDAGRLMKEEAIYDVLPNQMPGQSRLIGKLSLYYSSVEGGTHIACLTHEGAARGWKSHTSVLMWRCLPNRNCEQTDIFDEDTGNFSKLAGPVQITGTSGRCVTLYGHMQVPGTRKVHVVVMEYAGCDAIGGTRRNTVWLK